MFTICHLKFANSFSAFRYLQCFNRTLSLVIYHFPFSIRICHCLDSFYDFSVPLWGRGFKWCLLFVHVFVLKIFQKSIETLVVSTSHGIVVKDSFLLEVHGREAPMHPQMNWNEHQPVVENIHFSRPPLHSRVTLLHDFGVEECVGCVDLD